MRKGKKYALGFAIVWGLAIGPILYTARAAESGTPHNKPIAEGVGKITPRSPWCSGYKLTGMTQEQRLSGKNLERLRAAQSELAPGFAPESVKTGLYLLADYQEELEKRRPDVTLAASYLALASTVPVTAARFRDVNALLCVSTAKVTAESIQKLAESLRKQDNAPSSQSKGSNP